MLGLCWAYVWPRTARSFCATPKRRGMWDVWRTYVGPCWALGAMLGPCWGHVGAMLGPCWGHVGAMLGPCWGHVGAMLGPCWGHVGAMLGPCWSYVRPRPACSFWGMTSRKKNTAFCGSFWAHVGTIGTYAGPMLVHVGLLGAMLGPILGPCWAYVRLRTSVYLFYLSFYSPSIYKPIDVSITPAIHLSPYLSSIHTLFVYPVTPNNHGAGGIGTPPSLICHLVRNPAKRSQNPSKTLPNSGKWRLSSTCPPRPTNLSLRSQTTTSQPLRLAFVTFPETQPQVPGFQPSGSFSVLRQQTTHRFQTQRLKLNSQHYQCTVNTLGYISVIPSRILPTSPN